MALLSLNLTSFRSYDTCALSLDGQSLYLFGPNGAGKTNLLEAVSCFGPGRGLRGAAFADFGRRLAKENEARPWAVSAQFGDIENPTRIGTGADPAAPTRRLIRIDEVAVSPARLLDHVRLVWLTPAQDRLFIEGRSDRLKFFDRLVFADVPEHAASLSGYERALRERLKLLTDGPADPVWLDGLEHKLAESGAEIILRRRATLCHLQAEIYTKTSVFPRANLNLIDGFERIEAGDWLESFLRDGLKSARSKDAASGRSLFGPHRADLAVFHAEKAQAAALCSTGEQKALVLNLVLAQAARLAKQTDRPKPLILLDEVAAHLDPERRKALFDETTHLGLQTLFTGTDFELFSGLKGRARGIRIESSQFVAFKD